jgi:signal peptidase I
MTESGIEVQPTAAPQTAQPAPLVRARSGLYSLQSLAGTIVIAIFVITFIVQAFQIPSESMEKTLLVGDYLLVDKAHYGQSSLWNWLLPYRPIRRQDIIVFRYPVNPNQHFVKRVVAIPGDHVRLIDKHVYVNGVRQDDAYATFRWGWHDRFRDEFPDGGFYGQVTGKWFVQAQRLIDDGELVVPQDSYFVLGDNRDDSYDSRYWGLVPGENIVGRPLLIYWSMDRTDTALAGPSPSDKLSPLTSGPGSPARTLLARWSGDVSQLLNSFRWHRVLRIPR